MRWATLLAFVAACWQVPEEAQKRRLWEMQDHDDALQEAREAIHRGDLGMARQTGAWLSSPDLVPGLPESAAVHLAAVRADGRALESAPDLAGAATLVTRTTAHCAACHSELAVPAPDGSTPTELVWLGLVFESEERWSAGKAAAPPSGETWDERREAVARELVR